MKILIIKLSAIGDVIHTLPALDLLARTTPGSSITWVVEEKAAGIVLGHHQLARVIVSKRTRWIHALGKPSHWLSTWREFVAFVRELRSDTYDLVIDFQGLFKSAVLVWLSRGRQKAGYDKTREMSYLVLNRRVAPLPDDAHAVKKNLHLVIEVLNLTESGAGAEAVQNHDTGVPLQTAEKLSVEPAAADFALCGCAIATGEQEKNSVNALLRSCRITATYPLVLIHASAGWATKRWDVNKMAALADGLISTYEAQILFTGAVTDAAYIDTIISCMRYPSVNAAGRTSLKELACLIRRAQLFISTDSGPMHLAAALGTPIIAIFGPTAPWKTGPYTKRARIMRNPVSCSPCFRRSCDATICMSGIGVNEVMEASATYLHHPGDGQGTDGDETVMPS